MRRLGTTAEPTAGQGFDRGRPSLRLTRPFGAVCGLGLVAVLLPPYNASWVVLAASVVTYLAIAALLLYCRDETGAIVRRSGIMSVVERGGRVRPGDRITVELPPVPHSALDVV